jgi:hypothetical protein
MADTNDPQPAYRITSLLAATKVAQEWARIRPSAENAREIVAEETPMSLASSLEVIRSFTQVHCLASWHQDLPVRVPRL